MIRKNKSEEKLPIQVKVIFSVMLVSISLVLCNLFFFTRDVPFNLRVVEVTNSKSYFDIYDQHIMYDLSVVNRLHYSKLISPWKRGNLKDSLSLANERIMDEFFKTNYIEKISDDSIIQNFDIKKYLHTPMSFDSVFCKIEIIKTISIKGKPPQ